MKMYGVGEVDLQVYTFLTLALVGGEWLAPCPGHFTPLERTLCTHCVEGMVAPRISLKDVENRKFLALSSLNL
jgi:hypothetical protein